MNTRHAYKSSERPKLGGGGAHGDGITPETKNPAARVKTTDAAAGRFTFPVVKGAASILSSTRQKGGRRVSSI